MSDAKLPTEVELVYEVMPCNAMRSSLEPMPGGHACTYFHKWGTYHSFDYIIDGIPDDKEVPLEVKYVGRARLVPEILSGCRKSPIMAVGINPNLPGWFKQKRASLNPLFDSYKQYAHYFRYRSTYKLIIPAQQYKDFGGGDNDTPFSEFELNVPKDASGNRKLTARVDTQTMYTGYEGLLKELAQKMGWDPAELKLEEDWSYMNMVACPSAKWRTQKDPADPQLPPMTTAERDGIVSECFNERKHFLRQLYQSLPRVILVFSQTTATPFIAAMKDNFTKGNPQPNEKIADLLERHIRLTYGKLPDGTNLDARVIFSPHISGDQATFQALRKKVLDQLLDEAQSGKLTFNQDTKHLHRGVGACSFCPMLEIGPCPYQNELKPISIQTSFFADAASPADIIQEKMEQTNLMMQSNAVINNNPNNWEDDPDGYLRV